MANNKNDNSVTVILIVVFLILAVLGGTCSKSSSYDGTHRSDADMNKLR